MSHPTRTLALSLALAIAPLVSAVQAQETTVTTATSVVAPAPMFAYPLGTAPLGGADGTCSVKATAPRASAAKDQQLKFIVDYQTIPDRGADFRYYTVSTGKSKSLAQVQAMFADGFARAFAAPPGAELCKLGDIAHGGEVRLVARGGGETELAYNPPLSTGNPVFTAAESAAFARILR